MTISKINPKIDEKLFQKSCPLSKKPKVIVKIKLVKFHQFTIKLSPHLSILEEKINSLISSNCSFNESDRSWIIEINLYSLLIKSLKDLAHSEDLNIHFAKEVWKPLLNLLLQYYSLNKKQNILNIKLFRKQIHPSFRTRLYNYQLAGVYFIKSRKGCCILADQLGLGKRVQAIVAADIYKGDWPVLIICNENLKHLWFAQLQEWLPNFSNYNIFLTQPSTSNGSIDNSIQIVISSYESASKLEANLLKNKYDVVIVDECHNLKKGSEVFYSIRRLLQKSIRRLLLTSAPPYLKPVEIYRFLNTIDSKTFPKNLMKAFKKRYYRFPDLYQLPIDHTREYKRFLFGTNVLARGRNEVQKDLPVKQRDLIPLPCNIESQKIKLLEKKYKTVIKHLSLSNFNLIKSAIQEWFDISQQIKIKVVKNYLDTFLEMKHYKIILFANSFHFAQELENLLISKTIKYVKIDPRRSELERQKSCLLFDQDDNIKAAIISLKFKSSDKICLKNINGVFFCELDWNLEKFRNAENVMFGVEDEVVNNVYYQYFYLINCKYHLDNFLIEIINKQLKIKRPFLLQNNHKSSSNLKQEDIKEKLIQFLKQWPDHDCDVNSQSNDKTDLKF